MRHEHKYLTTRLPARHWFYFTSAGSGLAPAAGNLGEFVQHLHRAEPDVLDFHLARGDFSRWISGALKDATLGDAVAQVECVVEARHAADVENARRQLAAAIEGRYRPPARQAPDRPTERPAAEIGPSPFAQPSLRRRVATETTPGHAESGHAESGGSAAEDGTFVTTDRPGT